MDQADTELAGSYVYARVAEDVLDEQRISGNGCTESALAFSGLAPGPAPRLPGHRQ